MIATQVFDDAVAWIGMPVMFVLSGLGVGLLVERVAGLRLPAAALLPLGVCTSICGLLAVYRLQLDWRFAAPVLVFATLAGFAVARWELRARLAPGAAAVAGLAVAGLYLAPTVLTGHWSWNGYNFLNDTAVQFLLVGDPLVHRLGVPTRIACPPGHIGRTARNRG